MQIPDSIICNLLNEHQEKGMEYLFASYYKPLVVWAASFLSHNLSHAEDLVQDFFIRLWEKGNHQYWQPETFKSFLYISVRNLALDRIEKKDPLKNASAVYDIDKTWEEYDSVEEEMLSEIKQTIEKLPPRSREIIQCIYLQGLQYKETANKLGISVATVNTLLVNALKKIRQASPDFKESSILFLLLSEKIGLKQ